jgi:hypothetical protein
MALLHGSMTFVDTILTKCLRAEGTPQFPKLCYLGCSYGANLHLGLCYKAYAPTERKMLSI